MDISLKFILFSCLTAGGFTILGLWLEHRYHIWDPLTRTLDEVAMMIVGIIAVLMIAFIGVALFICLPLLLIGGALWLTWQAIGTAAGFIASYWQFVLAIIGLAMLAVAVLAFLHCLASREWNRDGRYLRGLVWLLIALVLLVFAIFIVTSGVLQQLLLALAFATMVIAFVVIQAISLLAGILAAIMLAFIVMLSKCGVSNDARKDEAVITVTAIPPEAHREVEWTQVASATAEAGDGCIRMLRKLQVDGATLDGDRDTTTLEWCLRTSYASGREIYWSMWNMRWTQAPRVCMQTLDGTPERWTLWRRGEEFAVEMPGDSPACTAKRYRK